MSDPNLTRKITLIGKFASALGTNDAALRLLLSVLVAYPISVCYRKFLYEKGASKTTQNLFFAIGGLLICLFNYGIEIYHSLLAVITTYLIINLLYNTKLMVPVSFCFHMGYLLIGYYFTTTEHYDITWTMCHCVLVLHLIGLTFDVSDNKKDPNVLGITDDRTVKIPSLLEIFSFSYFPATVLIGPQFSYKRFYEFIDYKYSEGKEYMTHGLKRGAIGIFYLAVYQLGLFIVPDSYLLTQEFAQRAFLSKMLLLGLWGRFSFYKYISCWLISEGAATCFGMTYVGKDKVTGAEDWSGCANIKLQIFENTRKFGNYVESFNIQTNQWVLKYVYKRLKFLGNKNISHLSTLMFLAVWHGFHCGYYMTFFLEFVVIHFEKEMEPIFTKNEKFQQFIKLPTVRPIVFIALKFYTIVFAGFCLIPFAFLSFHKWWFIYKNVYFFGLILFFPATHVYKPIMLKLMKIYFPPDRKTEKVSEENSIRENHEKAN